MNETKTLERLKFSEGIELSDLYYETPNPYKSAPSCNVNLFELSIYAKKSGKNWLV